MTLRQANNSPHSHPPVFAVWEHGDTTYNDLTQQYRDAVTFRFRAASCSVSVQAPMQSSHSPRERRQQHNRDNDNGHADQRAAADAGHDFDLGRRGAQ